MSLHRLNRLALTAAIASLTAASGVALSGQPAFAQAAGIAKAEQLINQGRAREAVAELRKSQRAGQNDPRARIVLARAYIELRQGIPAQTEIEAARRLGASRDDTRHLYAEALVLQGKFTDALKEADATSIPTPFRADAARVRAMAQSGLKNPDAANRELSAAEAADPGNVRVKLERARLEAGAKNIPAAVSAVDAALKLQPTNVRALMLKGDLSRGTEGLAKALGYFNQALQIDPGNFEALIERAATYVDLRREQEARADLKKVFAVVPDHPLGLYLEAVMRARTGDYAGAQGLMTRTKGALDKYPPAMLLQGAIAYETNNLEQAKKYLGDAVAASPNSAVARRMYGAALMRQGDADGTITTLKPLFDKGEADPRLLSLMGSAYARKGDFNTAQKYFEQAVAAEPNAEALRTQLAMTRVATGDNRGATEDLQDVLRIDPKSLQALMMTTLIDLRASNFKVAEASAKRLIATYPKLPIGYNMLGAAYLGLNNLKSAEANFRKSLEMKPDYHEARRNLAQLLVAQKRFDEARRELLRVLDTDRGNLRTMLALSNLAGQQNKTDEQLDWLRKAVGANPQSLQPRLALVQTYLKLGDKKGALNEATSLERDFPQNSAALEILASAHMASNNYGDAVRVYNRIIGLLPDNVNARVLLARAQAANKQIADARATYQRALTIKGQQLAPVLVDLVNFEANQGNYSVALGYANQLRKEYPNQNVADMTIGNIYMGAKDFGKAVASYETAKKVKFDRQVAVRLSQAYLGANQPDKGISVLREWLAKNPNDVIIRVGVADIYLANKRYDAALKEYQAVVRKQPKNAAILNNIAFIYDLKNDSRTQIVAEGAYKLAPNSPEIADTLGWHLIRTNKDPKRGLLLLQQAVQKRADNPDMRFHLAAGYRANGRTRDAVKELESLLAKYKSFDTLTQARAMLSDIKSTGK